MNAGAGEDARARARFEALAAAACAALGLGVPDDVLPSAERLRMKHHNGIQPVNGAARIASTAAPTRSEKQPGADLSRAAGLPEGLQQRREIGSGPGQQGLADPDVGPQGVAHGDPQAGRGPAEARRRRSEAQACRPRPRG